MIYEERAIHILNLIKNDGFVNRRQLVEKLKVSNMTIGRDLKKLEREGLLELTHGGAILKQNSIEEIKYENKQKENILIKRKMAEEGFKLIKEGSNIILDAGTSCYELANLIAKTYINLTVITNDLYIALELYKCKHIRLIFIGGELVRETASANSIETIKQLENYKIDLAFIGTSAISNDFELSVASEIKEKIKKTMLKQSKQKILLVDKTKFNKRKLYKFCHINDFDYIITDFIFQNLNENLRNKIINIREVENV